MKPIWLNGRFLLSRPIGKGLLGKALGDIADIETPRGVIQFEVVKIERA